MAIALSTNFLLGTGLPLDGRTVVADTTARDAISSIQRYDGLIVYTVSGAKNYQLRGGILNANWVDISSASVVSAALTKVDDTNVTLTLGGTPATSLLQSVSLTLGWTGTLADARIASAATWNAKVSSQWITTGSDIYYNTGKVGIGVTAPSKKLEVFGDIALSNLGLIGQGLGWGTPSAGNYATMQMYDSADGYTKINNVGFGIQIQTAGTAKLTVLNGGNVGLNVTAPTQILDVRGAYSSLPATSGTIQTGTARFRSNAPTPSTVDIGSNNTTGTGWIQATDVSNLAINYSLLLNPNGGNVGIGTTAPLVKLEVNGVQTAGPSTTDKGILLIAAPSNQVGLSIGNYNSSPYGMWLQSMDNRSGVNTTYPLILNPIGGNVGIGITGPSEKLETAGNISLKSSGGSSFDNLGEIDWKNLGNAATNAKIWTRRGASNYGSGQLVFETAFADAGTTERMRIDDIGNVGIGTTAPDMLLHLKNSNNYQLELQSIGTGGGYWRIGQTDTGFGSGGGRLVFTADGTASANAQVTFMNSGNVGIGTTAPITSVDINNNNNSTSLRVFDSANSTFIGTDGSGGFFGVNVGNYSGGWTNPVATNPAGMVYFDNSGAFYVYTRAASTSPAYGSAKMTVSNGGNVGIGTTTPTTKLYVFDSGANLVASFQGANVITPLNILGGVGTGAYWRESFIGQNIDIDTASGKPKTLTNGYRGSAIGFNSDASQGQIHFFTANGSTAGTVLETRMTINPDGNVGIGTTAPSSKLTVSGGGIRLTGTNQNALEFRSNADGAGLVIGRSYGSDNANNFFIYDNVNSAARLFIDNGGNVGIGTTAPKSKLDIVGGSAAPAASGDMVTGLIVSGGYGGVGLNMGILQSSYSWIQSAYTDSAGTTVPLAINPVGGNVGIGTVAPNYPLHVHGNNSYIQITSTQTGTASTDGAILGFDGAAGDTALYIRQRENSPMYLMTNDTTRVTINANGTVTATSTVTATNFILSSDRRLKTNVFPISNYNPVTVPYVEFELLSEPGQKRVGVIAQDLEIEHPEFVRTDDKGIKSVAYTDLHSKEISDLKYQLKIMMDRITELERRLT